MRKVQSDFLSADGKTRINVLSWQPDEPKGVLQIAHGMVEFADRYDELGRWLAEQGFLVVANDHLGHGDSVLTQADWGYFADEDGWGKVLADMHTLRQATAADYPDLPYFLLGHSMGSFLVRHYLLRWPQDNLSGAIIVGTGQNPNFLLAIAKALAAYRVKTKGARYRCELLTRLALGKNNKFFQPVRTRNDWLTRDESIVDQYNADPRDNFVFTAQAYFDFFGGLKAIGNKDKLERMDRKLPLIFMSGEKDPIGNQGKGVKQACALYRRLGCTDLELKLYPEARHEIFNEINRENVYTDLLDWLMRQNNKSK
ncbi:MAG: lysophospholipase [Saccharofermentanales bacterium]